VRSSVVNGSAAYADPQLHADERSTKASNTKRATRPTAPSLRRRWRVAWPVLGSPPSCATEAALSAPRHCGRHWPLLRERPVEHDHRMAGPRGRGDGCRFDHRVPSRVGARPPTRTACTTTSLDRSLLATINSTGAAQSSPPPKQARRSRSASRPCGREQERQTGRHTERRRPTASGLPPCATRAWAVSSPRALARSASATSCGSCVDKDSPLCKRRMECRTRNVAPLLDLLLAVNEDVDRPAKIVQGTPKPDHLGVSVGNIRLDDEEVEVATGTRISARPRAEEDHPHG